MKFLMVEVVVNKRIILGGLAGIFAAIAFPVVFVSPGVFAGEGGSTGDGGVNGCHQDYGYWTCYGATWRYYTTNSDRVYIEGYTDKDHAYAAAGYVEGCAKYGGYWRYAMVEVVGNHKQYGLIGIGGNNSAYLSNTYNSQFFGGGMQYIPPTPGDGLNANNAQWRYVEQLYKDLQKRFPEDFKSGWNKNSNLAWFCGPDNIDKLDVKLTGVPVDDNGNELPKTTLTGTGGDGHAVVWEKTVTPEEGLANGATVGAGLDTSSTYSFTGWYSDREGKNLITKNRIHTEQPLTSNKTIYAVYRKNVTLTAKSINYVDGSSLSNVSGLGDKSVAVSYNTNASIERGTNEKYAFSGWRENSTDGNYSQTDKTYVANNLTSNKTVYAVYKPYVTLSAIAVVADAECTEISKYNSVHKVEYNGRVVADSSTVPGTSFEGWSFERCGKIENQLESYEVEHLTTNMVIYEIHSQPKLPCSDSYAVLSSNCDANLDIEQSKKSDGDWGKGELYMKPGDRVYLRGSYEPKYQDQKDRIPEKLKMASADSYENNDHNYTIEVYLNSKMDPGPHWNNAFSIMKDGSCVKTIEGTSGSNDKYFGTHNYTALLGKKAVAKAATNTCVDSQSTIKKIKYSYDYNYDLRAEIDDSNNESSEVVAYTPYNFENKIEVTNEEKDAIVFAGETKRINYSMKVGDRENKAVGATYHTKVEGAMFKLKLDYGDGTYEVTPATKFNINDGKDGDIVANIKDLPAGTEIYVSACVYPATSDYDENWTEKEGDKQWACSESKKFVVAKRPSLQVWGGGVYTNGNIATPSSVKSTLAGIPDYVYSASDSGDKKVAFGSWAEQAVVANGAVNGLASGAATGLNLEINGGVYNGIVEGKNQNYCSRVPLSFANTINRGCPENGTTTGWLGAKHSELDRKAFIDYVIGDTNASITKLMAVNEDGSYSLNSGVLNDASLLEKSRNEDGEEIDSNTRVVVVSGDDGGVMAAGTIVIDGNIQYEDNKVYTGLGELPKIIIYADNINIACNVTRIDAILIANNKVDTCPTYKEKDTELSPANDRQNSTQLVINGMIITNKLDLNRTYGAATGVNSGVPAEIVNYDTSTILWSMNQIDTDNYAGMSTVYQHEVAPRY